MSKMQETFIDKTPTGLGFEVRRLKGYHQKWLTTSKTAKAPGRKNNEGEKGLDDVLMDVLVHYGDHHFGRDEKEDRRIMNMIPSWDLKYMLLVSRFFSTDIHFSDRMAERKEYEEALAEAQKHNKDNPDDKVELPIFESQLPPHIYKFKYSYNNENDEKVEHEYNVELYLWDFKYKAPLFRAETVEELAGLDQFIMMPLSGEKVRWTPLNVGLENRFKGAKEVNANTGITWRNPCKMVKTEKDEVGTLLNLDRMELLDIEALRSDIYEKEGKVDSRIYVRHPETEEEFPVDVTQAISFFFPSAVA